MKSSSIITIMKQNLSGLVSIVFVLVIGCSSGNDNNSSSAAILATEGESDTVVMSDPNFYFGVMDTLSSNFKSSVSSYKDLLDLFEAHNYTPESWQAGIREVPRIYITKIGDRWGSQTTKEITVLMKKQIFFRGIAPMILRSNELILKDRGRLERIRSEMEKNNSLEENDRIWISKLAALYKVDNPDHQISRGMMEELWNRVDIIPPSLALSQGAEESGWGTSRFAAEGNAVYGQWTWGENAIVPEQQRKELGNYGIAAFSSLPQSVSSYMLNLNTHQAYAALRNKRAELRKSGKKVTGMILAEQLSNYSERGEDYVKTLKSLMEYNRLIPTDDAYLADAPPIYLLPSD